MEPSEAVNGIAQANEAQDHRGLGHDLYRHGRHGVLGFFYLNTVCVLRIVADIVQIVDDNSKSALAPTILNSIGLTPLMLALAGMLHEIHFYTLPASNSSHTRVKTINKWLWFVQIHIHTICAVGMVLLIIGGVHIATASSTSEVDSGQKLRIAGAMILLVLWMALLKYSLWLNWRVGQLRLKVSGDLSPFGTWCAIAAGVIGIKVIYMVVYSFDHDPALNPNTGSFAVKVVINVLVSLFAAVFLAIGGWKSRDISMDYSCLVLLMPCLAAAGLRTGIISP